MTDNVVWLDFNDAPDQAPESALDAEAIRRGLLDRLEPVLFQLFPAGRIRGGKFFIGDVHGDAGDEVACRIEVVPLRRGRAEFVDWRVLLAGLARRLLPGATEQIGGGIQYTIEVGVDV